MWGLPEKAYLTSRALPFEVHSVEARPAQDAVQAFAYRSGAEWHVLYVGRRADHMIDTAIGYGATHRLIAPEADEAWLIDELKPLLNGR